LLAPATPPRPEEPLPLRAFLRALRTNALTIWPHDAYRRDVTIRRLFGRTNLLLNAPDAVHHVLVANPGNYRRSPASIRILRPITGQGLLLSEGESWRLQRRTIAPALAPRVLPTLSPHIALATWEAITRLDAAADAPVDLLGAMQALALNIAGRTMFSVEMAAHGAMMRQMLAEFALRHARPGLLDLLLPTAIPSLRDIGRLRFQSRWMGLIETIMRPRLAEPVPAAPRDLFDLLRAARDPETGAGFTDVALRDQVATMILAGHETTAVTLFWALTLLAQAPDQQASVAREVAGLDFSPAAAHDALARLPYTRAVVHEVLRLFPPAFVLVREAMGPDEPGGIPIRRRDVVMIAPWVLHRHHSLWQDPDSFDPARFLPDAPQPPRFAYLPFGAGPRVCVGAQFALTEATIALAAMIQRFWVSLAGQRPVLPVAIVTTQPDHAPPFVLRRR
jgi:cytochrome P450